MLPPLLLLLLNDCGDWIHVADDVISCCDGNAVSGLGGGGDGGLLVMSRITVVSVFVEAGVNVPE